MYLFRLTTEPLADSDEEQTGFDKTARPEVSGSGDTESPTGGTFARGEAASRDLRFKDNHPGGVLVQQSAQRAAKGAHTARLTSERLDKEAMSTGTALWLRWIARALSVVVIAGFIYAYVRYGAPGADD